MLSFVVIVLAAGAGARFGGPKQIAVLDGEPLISKACNVAAQAGAAGVIVVLGAWADQIRPHVPPHAEIIENDQWKTGMASSIRAGVKALSEQAEVALFVLADQPMVSSGHLRELVSQLQHAEVSASAYPDGSAGVPAAFRRSRFATLMYLEGDQGAKRLIVDEGSDAALVPLQDAADVDTPADLEALTEHPDRYR